MRRQNTFQRYKQLIVLIWTGPYVSGRCWFGTSGNWTPRSFPTCEVAWQHRQEPPNLKITPPSTLPLRFSSWPYQVRRATWPLQAHCFTKCFNKRPHWTHQRVKLKQLWVWKGLWFSLGHVCSRRFCCRPVMVSWCHILSSRLFRRSPHRSEGESSGHVRREVQAV